MHLAAKLLTLLAPALALALSWPACAQEAVVLEYAAPGSSPAQVRAVLRKPVAAGNGQAVLILHHGGGFGAGTTTPYAELFTRNGFTTLELRMFETANNRPPHLAMYAMVASALRYLAGQPGVAPDKVSAMGLSLGAFLTIGATSSWFYAHHQLDSLRFRRLAAVYPVCWMMSEALQRQTQGLVAFDGLPSDFLQSFAAVPLLILAGGKDNYDGSNPAACPSFARSIPDSRQASLVEVKVYPEATHGWDHGRSYDFLVFGGCAVRATCRNYNVFSPATTEKGQRDVLQFFSQP